MCTQNELNIILQKIAQIYGSYARGDYNHDSDVDL